MGDRGQVKIEDIYLYTHWGGYKLKDDVCKAISKGWRWNDPEYLTRIIFDEMIGDEKGTETGFGISTSIHGDTQTLIEIDLNKQEILVKSREYETDSFKLTETIPFRSCLK